MAYNSNTTTKDIYQTVTDKIIASLEAGTIPWKSPYLATIGFPRNFASGKEYRGINVWLLALAGYASPFWLTFKQAQELGGHVRKGEKGSLVIKYGTFEKEDDESGEAEKRCFLKGYTVFNASQIEGITFPKPEQKPLPSDSCGDAKMIVAGMPNRPGIHHGTATAFYRPATDSVHMPEMENMISPKSYYGTLFHELCHSTGAANRLNRKSLTENKGMHGNRNIYSEEELVAEMGASFLSAIAGISDQENNAAYIQGWLNVLKAADAKAWVIRAAAQGQRAADYILNAPKE